jgi:UDP-N-acetylmuramyl pentapeptide phosphotransferase/UDP-N-acetylglucosamine-1-phosphate transferase
MTAALDSPLFAAAACAVAAWAVLALLLKSGLAARWALDLPNDRSLHSRPTPRICGLALLAVSLPWLAWAAQSLREIVAVTVALAAVSAIDDRRSLPVGLRLGVHVAASVAAVWLLLPDAAIAWKLAVAAAIVWSINLYNFMDGADGLAGGMTIIGFSALGIAAHGAGDAALAIGCLAIAGGATGFLVHNFHPASVFLGDAGSIPIGYLAAAAGVYGFERGLWPAWFPLMVFSPFIVDASLTLVGRLLQGDRPWKAHKTHAYQRMIASGWGHARTAVTWYGLMIAAAASALFALKGSDATQLAFIGAWGIAYGLLWTFMRRWFHRAS